MTDTTSTPTTSHQHIESTADMCSGQPRLTGRRITVAQIAFWHERLGTAPDQIASKHGLSLGEVYAALSYYHDHRVEIDAQVSESAEFAEELRRAIPSWLNPVRPAPGGSRRSG